MIFWIYSHYWSILDPSKKSITYILKWWLKFLIMWREVFKKVTAVYFFVLFGDGCINFSLVGSRNRSHGKIIILVFSIIFMIMNLYFVGVARNEWIRWDSREANSHKPTKILIRSAPPTLAQFIVSNVPHFT